MKKFLVIAILAVLFSLVSMNSQAQTREYYVFTADTITNTGTATFTCPFQITGPGNTISWYVNYTQLSGTSAYTAARQQSNRPAGTDFATIQTWTAVDTCVNATPYGAREQMLFTGSGTHSTKLEVTVILQKP